MLVGLLPSCWDWLGSTDDETENDPAIYTAGLDPAPWRPLMSKTLRHAGVYGGGMFWAPPAHPGELSAYTCGGGGVP
jgi:hypothetical protein